MFTGLIEDIGTIEESRSQNSGRFLRIRTALPLAEIALGDSIAVDGVCLTVISKAESSFSFEVSQESLTRSTLALRHRGDRVHLERALALGARLGGHIVQGHVDGLGEITRVTTQGDWRVVEISCPQSIGRYLIEKGSIAVDGTSLTVNERSDTHFSLVLVPHTLSKTLIVEKGVGAKVNLEIDLIAKYVERLFPGQQLQPKSALDMAFLQKHGFADE
jgi:riboflavin synthase